MLVKSHRTDYDKLTDFKTISRIDPEELFISLMTNCDRIVMNAVGKYIQECNIT